MRSKVPILQAAQIFSLVTNDSYVLSSYNQVEPMHNKLVIFLRHSFLTAVGQPAGQILARNQTRIEVRPWQLLQRVTWSSETKRDDANCGGEQYTDYKNR